MDVKLIGAREDQLSTKHRERLSLEEISLGLSEKGSRDKKVKTEAKEESAHALVNSGATLVGRELIINNTQLAEPIKVGECEINHEDFIQSSQERGIGAGEEAWFAQNIQDIKGADLTDEEKEILLIQRVQIRIHQHTTYGHDIDSVNGPNPDEANLRDHWSELSDIEHDGGKDIDCDDFAEYSRALLQAGGDDLGLNNDDSGSRIWVDADGDGVEDHAIALWQPSSGREYVIDGTFYQRGRGDANEILTPEIYESMNRFGENNSILSRDASGDYSRLAGYTNNGDVPNPNPNPVESLLDDFGETLLTDIGGSVVANTVTSIMRRRKLKKRINFAKRIQNLTKIKPFKALKILANITLDEQLLPEEPTAIYSLIKVDKKRYATVKDCVADIKPALVYFGINEDNPSEESLKRCGLKISKNKKGFKFKITSSKKLLARFDEKLRENKQKGQPLQKFIENQVKTNNAAIKVLSTAQNQADEIKMAQKSKELKYRVAAGFASLIPCLSDVIRSKLQNRVKRYRDTSKHTLQGKVDKVLGIIHKAATDNQSEKLTSGPHVSSNKCKELEDAIRNWKSTKDDHLDLKIKTANAKEKIHGLAAAATIPSYLLGPGGVIARKGVIGASLVGVEGLQYRKRHQDDKKETCMSTKDLFKVFKEIHLKAEASDQALVCELVNTLFSIDQKTFETLTKTTMVEQGLFKPAYHSE